MITARAVFPFDIYNIPHLEFFYFFATEITLFELSARTFQLHCPKESSR